MNEQCKTIVDRLVRPEIAALVPYASARREVQGGKVWLNANESPWNNTDIEGVNRYPDCQPVQLRNAYATFAEVQPAQVLISRGADEGIDLLMRAFCRPGVDSIATCAPSYGMYAVSAATNAVACRTLEWADGYQLPDDFVRQVADCKLVFVCNPNNPSGTIIPREKLVELAGKLPNSLLVVDEAYIEFCPQHSIVGALKECPNLVVLRTLSKAFALAGARCGFTIANEPIIAILEKVIAPYPVPKPVAELALEALSQTGIKRMHSQVARLNALRDSIAKRLSRFETIQQVIPSQANFILFKISNARACYESLVRQGLLVRAYSRPELADWLRITIGSENELNQVESALKESALKIASSKLESPKETTQ